MLPIVLNEEERQYIAKAGKVTVDLPNQTVTANDKTFHFDIDETWKNKLVNGLDDIAVTLQFENEIQTYETSKAF